MIPALVEAGRNIKTVTVHKRSAPDIDKKEDLHKKLKTGSNNLPVFFVKSGKKLYLSLSKFWKI